MICSICELHASGNQASDDQAKDGAINRYAIARSEHWLLRHHPDPSPLLGWLLLDARRHLGGPADFTPPEAAAWGPAVQQASQLVRQLTDCDRVYAIAFGEGARHLHLHLIPRFGDDPQTKAWSVADHYRAVEAGERPAADPAQVAALVSRARSQAEDLFEPTSSRVLGRHAAQDPAAMSPSTSLARRNSQRLAADVQRRAALLSSEDLAPSDVDTELDLLIDRLHDLALEQDQRF